VTVLRDTRAALTDALLVLVDAGRLLVRHLPALLTVFLLGLAARNAVMWAAVLLGREHPVLASLLVPLAPLSMVVALVVMLRLAGGPVLSAEDGGGRSQWVAVLSSALVPFLTVYALTGELEKDQDQFINESYADEFFNGDFFATTALADRSLVTVTSWQIGIIAVVLVLRLVVDLLDLVERHPGWGFAQALLEVTWLTWLATLLTSRWRDARSWLGDRVAVHRLQDAWDTVTGWLGPLTDPLRTVGDLVADAVDRVGAVLATPVAWLAVGAVVVAGSLPTTRKNGVRLPEPAQRIHERVAPGLARWLTRPRRPGTSKALELLGRRFGDLADGLRIMVHAGVLPVLAFCLVLPLARLAEWGAALGVRALVGPRDPYTMVAASPYLDIVSRAAYTVVVVVIVAAAVDRLLLRRDRPEPLPAPRPEPGQPSLTSRST
jgi:hypothetical protein